MTWIAIVLLAAATPDLDRIRLEADAPKRAVKAIEFANVSLGEARDRVSQGDFEAAHAALARMADAAELARESTEAKRNVGAMKKVEQRSREIMRRLETLKLDFPLEERDAVDAIQQRVRVVQEDVLASIMGRKK